MKKRIENPGNGFPSEDATGFPDGVTTMAIKRSTLTKAKRLADANRRSRPQQIEFLIDEAYEAQFGQCGK